MIPRRLGDEEQLAVTESVGSEWECWRMLSSLRLRRPGGRNKVEVIQTKAIKAIRVCRNIIFYVNKTAVFNPTPAR